MRSIIFDFDGVIADTFELCRTLTLKFDRRNIGAEEYKALFDGNVYHVGESWSLPSFRDEGIKRALQDAYADALKNYTPIPGIAQVIAELHLRTPLHIVSSGGGPVIENFLRRHEMRNYFDRILGFEIAYSKIEKFGILGIANPHAHRYLYITDTLGDLLEAQKVGMSTIAVSWGFHDIQRLQQGNPGVIVHTPDELLKAILDVRYTKE